jgi:hypothetical protein
MSYSNTNTGILARNERKEKDTHPDFSGTINVDGVDYWLSGWTREGKPGSKLEGKRYFSLAVKPKEERQAPAPQRRAPPTPARSSGGGGSGFDDLSDDIPFAPMGQGRAFLAV